MSNTKKLIKHSTHYFIGELLVLVSGLVSFPIFTRIFTTEEYGVMSLLNITISFIGLIVSLGLRPAITRFYPQRYKEGGRKSVVVLYSTSLILTMIVGLILTGIVFMISYTPISFLPQERSSLLRVAAGLIIIRPVFKLLLGFLRVEQKTVVYNILYVLQQYITLASALIFVLMLQMGLLGLIGSQLLVESFFVAVLLGVMFYQGTFCPNVFSKSLAKQIFSFGVPLILLNFSHIIMTYGDRYVLSYFLGVSSVGVYSVGYNVSNYVAILLQTPFTTAIGPIYIELWEKEGKEATEIFLSRIVMYYCIISIGLLAGFIAVGEDVIVLLASSKYAESYLVAPFILAGVLLSGLNSICVAGLFLEKKTQSYGMVILGVSVVNIGLNIILVPLIGLVGAAVATISSYVILFLAIIKMSFSYLCISFNLVVVLKCIISASCMILMLLWTQINTSSAVITLVFKVIEGIFIYLIMLICLDKGIREELYRFLRREKFDD